LALAKISFLGLAVLTSGDIAIAAPVQAARSASNALQQRWIEQAGADLDPRAAGALAQILGTDRRLLALRAYLRAGASLDERWSWSEQQLSAYPSTAEGKAAAADIDTVITAFESANPGFTLRVNRMPRSLEVQIAHWNENRSVGVAAAALAASLAQRFGANASTPDPQALRTALTQWTPTTAAALAAPGLSPHGQARAFDFQIERDGQVIAGIDAASARQRWDRAGWTQKLHAAVSSTGNRFAGPLASPYEPWHYAYANNRQGP
jgi:hypothetical protein